MKKLTEKGSIALISILIISAFVIILAISMSEINISTSYQYMNHSANKRVYYVAESCLEEAFQRLETNPSFTGETITFDADTSCNITVNNPTISIGISYLNYTENFTAQYSITTNGQANNAQLLNWQES